MTGAAELDGKGGWRWRSRVVHLPSDDEEATARLDAALADDALLGEGFSVHAVLTADPGAGEYGRKPVVIVLFRKRTGGVD